MRALVTGAAGFLGRHFVAELQKRGFEVVEIDIAAPLRRRVDAMDVFRDDTTRFDLAVHCAAHVGGRETIDRRPLAQVMNLALDAAYIDWCERLRPHRAIYLSSSAAYPIALQRGSVAESRRALIETDIRSTRCEEPDAGYGWQKLTGERLVAQAWAENVNLTVIRPFSGYGTDQALDYPFPAFIDRAVRHQDPFPIWGCEEQTRDWIHVDDLIQAALVIADANDRAPVNIGTGTGTSLGRLARLVCELAGHKPQFQVDENAPMGVMHRVCDPHLMRTYYEPKITLVEGVTRALRRFSHV